MSQIFDDLPVPKHDSYTPQSLSDVVHKFSDPEHEKKLTDLRNRFEQILRDREILRPKFSPRELLESYRQSLLDRLDGLADNRGKIADLCAMFYDVLDPAMAFPVIMQKLSQMGDGLVDLIAAEDAGKRLLDSLETDYFVWCALNEGEAMADTVALQETKGKATAATARSISKEKIEAGLVRVKTEEYQILNERLSFVRRSVEMLGQFRETIKSMNFNLQKVGEWLAYQEGKK